LEDSLTTLDEIFAVGAPGWEPWRHGWHVKRACLDGAHFAGAWNGQTGPAAKRHVVRAPAGSGDLSALAAVADITDEFVT
jgi:hypothetical protein